MHYTDLMPHNPQIDRLSRLVSDSLYPMDEQAIAEAILARASLRQRVPGIAFRNDERAGARDDVVPAMRRSSVRSFRPTTRARSFQLTHRRPA